MSDQLDNFDEILDRCIIDIIEKNKSVAYCLENYPAYSHRLEPYLKLILRLEKGKELNLSEHKRNVLYTQLFERVRVSGRKPHLVSQSENRIPRQSVANRFRKTPHSPSNYAHRFGSIGRFAVAALVILLSIGIFGIGLVNVSAKSIPGEEYYPIKILYEQVQLGFSPSPSREIQLHLNFSRERLDEAEALIDKDDSARLTIALQNYNNHISEATRLLNSDGYVYNQPSPEILLAAIEIMATNQARLDLILDEIPDEQLELTLTAKDLSRQGIFVAEEILKLLPELLNLQDPGQFMRENRGLVGTSLIETASAQWSLTTPTLQFMTPPEGWTAMPEPQKTPAPIDWLNYTPQNPAVATAWSTIYPTLSNLATRISEITTTPRVPLRATRTQLPQRPFSYPRITPTPK